MDVPFEFDDACLKSFNILKNRDASDYAMGQCWDKLKIKSSMTKKTTDPFDIYGMR